MSGEKRSGVHRKGAAAVACGALLLAGLAAGSHWYRSAKAAGTAPPHIALASDTLAALSSFVPPPAVSHATISHATISHLTRPARAPASGASDARLSPANSPEART